MLWRRVLCAPAVPLQEMEWVYGLTGQAGSYMYMSPEASWTWLLQRSGQG